MKQVPAIHPRRVALIIAGVMLGVLLAALDGTIVGTAMPRIISELQGMALYNWPFTIYMLCSTIAIPIFGRIADLYGHKLTYLIGIAVFLTGSILCGLSANMIQLIVFRGIQGIGGGTIIANSFVIVGDLFSPAERAKFMGLLAAMFGLASIAGPVLGGLITDYLNWHWIFFVNIPVGIIALLIIIAVLPRGGENQGQKTIDFAGALTFILALVPMLLALTWAGRVYHWLAPQIIAMLFFSVVMFGLFGMVERKAAEPLIPLRLFHNSIFNVAILGAFIVSSVMFGGTMLLPLFMQKVLDCSATASGAVLTPMSVSLVMGGIITGLVITKTGKYKIFGILALIVMGIGTMMLQNINGSTAKMQIILAVVITGIGVGITMPVFDLAAQNAFPHHQIGLVTAMLQFVRNVGATTGSALLGSVLLFNMKRGHAVAIHRAFLVTVLLSGAGLIAILFLKEIPLRKTNVEMNDDPKMRKLQS